MAAFKKWVERLLPGVPPTSALGKALSYTMKQGQKLGRFLEHPEVYIDNNYLKNQIRPFAQGRGVRLFAQTQQGARASANLTHSSAALASMGSSPTPPYTTRMSTGLR